MRDIAARRDPFAAAPDAARELLLRDHTYRKIFWRIIPFLVLCYVISYLDRVNIGFAKLQMAGALGFSDTVFGVGAGTFFMGYFLFELPSNLLMQRVGARIWIARIMITWGLLSAAFIFVRTPASFYTMRFLLGAAEAGFYPGVLLYLTQWFPAYRRARIVALFMSAIPIAGILGNPFSGWIMHTFRTSTRLMSWQWMFFIEAAPAVIAGLAILLFLDRSPTHAAWLTTEERRVIFDEIAADLMHEAKGPHSVAGVFRDRRIWQMGLIYFTFVMGQYGLTFWMPTIVRSTGVNGDLRVGLLSAIPFVCAVVAMNLCGRSADRRQERRWHVIIPAILGAAGFLAVASFQHNTFMSLVALSLAAAGVLTCAPLFWSLPTAFLSGTGAAAGIAIINSIGNLAGFVSPLVIGYLRDTTHSGATGMYALAAVLLAGAFAVWFVPAMLVNR
jgi:D-galactonate transporter